LARAKEGDTVRVHYTGKLDDGSVFDSSQGRDPLEFTLGGGQVIPGFEQAILGMQPGESKTVSIESEEAYGPRRDELTLRVGRNQLPPEMEPQVGQRLQMQQGEQTVVVVITGVDAEGVTLDANHPLAGRDLTFELELVEVD
jgi:peptidylprolyl isomerase